MSTYSCFLTKPEPIEMIVKMLINGSGIRDAAKVLFIRKDTVMSVLKKVKNFSQTLVPSTSTKKNP